MKLTSLVLARAATPPSGVLAFTRPLMPGRRLFRSSACNPPAATQQPKPAYLRVRSFRLTHVRPTRAVASNLLALPVFPYERPPRRCKSDK